MIRNYLKTAFRTLIKNKGFTAINVLGLALGLCTCLLIVFYVFDELSYDRYNVNYDRIYRINTDVKYGSTLTAFAITAPPVGETLVKEFPEVEKWMHIGTAVNIRFKKGNEVIQEKNAVYCSNDIFSIFTLPMLAGDPKTALTNPNAIVISQSMALKYFNTMDAVGKTLVMAKDSSIHQVTGVIRDIPVQSHFKADFLIAADPKPDNRWAHFSIGTYILLKKGADYKKLESKFEALVKRYETTETSFNYKKFVAKGNYIRLSLTPLANIHLHSNRQRELGVNGNVQYIYIFSAIALFILLLACINFMNLSTARSADRAREVGVRKVLGSARKQLVAQFLSESILVTLAATIIAVIAAWALLPLFNQLSGKTLIITTQTFVWLLPALLLIIIVVGVLAGSYPAFFLSAFQPIHVLKGKLTTGFKGGFLRSFLVVFQFAISIFLIIGTLVIYNQLNHIQSKDLGFNRNQVLIIKNTRALSSPLVFQQEIKKLRGVQNATLTGYLPTGYNSQPRFVVIGSGTQVQTETQFWPIDTAYINTIGLKLLQGRNFSAQFATDSLAVIVNQTMANLVGYTGNQLAEIKIDDNKYHVIGVVKDFNFNSLRDNVTPLVMVLSRDPASLSIKINTAHLPALMERIEKKWQAMAPGQHFEYSFMDDDFNALYSSELRMGKLFITFTTLAILIACLGLFGLAAYAAEQRNKEIGIRKVLGASVSAIVGLLSTDFLKLVFIAILTASPLAWWAMNKWFLQGFAYRTNISWWVLAIAALGALLIAFVTVCFQSLKAALANPVESLRSE